MLNFSATCLVVILLACGHNFGPIPSSQAACGRWPAFDDDVIQNSELQTGQNFQARDSLRVGDEASMDAVDCLRGLSWELADFDVTLEAPRRGYGKFLVRFPTPRPSGNARVDRVAMEWYPARDDDGIWKTAPAMVIVHESGKNMTVGRLIAKGVAGWGIHAFLLQMPGYGERVGEEPADADMMLRGLQQAVADVRRARDAVAVLPTVVGPRVGLQGTSLGGFVASTVGGLDDGYHWNFILLAGGNLHEVLLSGKRDAARMRDRLLQSGLTELDMKELVRPIEPLRLAHRVVAERTWLYSGLHDDVVPPACSTALAVAAKLPPEHHIELPVDHYSGVTYLPKIIADMAKTVLDKGPEN